MCVCVHSFWVNYDASFLSLLIPRWVGNRTSKTAIHMHYSCANISYDRENTVVEWVKQCLHKKSLITENCFTNTVFLIWISWFYITQNLVCTVLKPYFCGMWTLSERFDWTIFWPLKKICGHLHVYL